MRESIRLPLADEDTMVAVKVGLTGLIDASDFNSVFLGADSGSKCSVAVTHIKYVLAATEFEAARIWLRGIGEDTK